MSDTSRRQRFAGRLKKLLDVCIETKQVQAGLGYAKLIMQIEGWAPTPSRDEAPDMPQPQSGPDMSALLQHISGDDDGQQS